MCIRDSNKEGNAAANNSAVGKRSPGGGTGTSGICSLVSNHARSTSYSVSYCMRKATGSPANLDAKGGSQFKYVCNSNTEVLEYILICYQNTFIFL